MAIVFYMIQRRGRLRTLMPGYTCSHHLCITQWASNWIYLLPVLRNIKEKTATSLYFRYEVERCLLNFKLIRRVKNNRVRKRKKCEANVLRRGFCPVRCMIVLMLFFFLCEKGKTRQQKQKHAVDNVQFCSRFPNKCNCLLIWLKLSRELKLSQFGQAIFIIVVGFSYWWNCTYLQSTLGVWFRCSSPTNHLSRLHQLRLYFIISSSGT